MLILTDVDDVLADFAPAFLDLAYKVTGKRYDISQYHTWLLDIEPYFTQEEAKQVWEALDNSPGLIRNLPELPNSFSALQELRTIGDVIAITAPHFGPLWFYERSLWLKDRGFRRSTMGFLKPKQIISSDVFLDDGPDHINKWKKKNPKGLGLLWDRPNTRSYQTLGTRVYSWDDVIERVLQYKGDLGLK